ncbi:MAG: glycosyltransferase family 4 protein [Ignavibacteria bacterium]|jgi:glycosyltransferase involved in cell wall biosynthesis|nr:glycosyltransferase family 4 protein [Ignavibacteria bacterium]MDH7527400.1 glycosyltransferase family 1 protein [Ignavibacteria bacterium]
MRTYKKNICIDARFIYPQIDGIGRYLYNLIKHLILITQDRDDIKFTILEIDKFYNNSLLRNFEGEKNIDFVKIPIIPHSILNNFIYYLIRNYQISLFHYPQFNFPLIMKYPSIVTIHDLNPQTFPNFFVGLGGLFKKYYSIFENKIALLKANKIIAVSNNTKKELIKFYGEKFEDKIEVIYLGIDEKFLLSRKQNYYQTLIEPLRKKYNFKEYFLYVGNNRPHKNILLLLKAFKEFKSRNSNKIKLLLIGKFFNDRYMNLQKELIELNLTEDVINFTVTDDELISLYSNALAFIYISLSEGFGLPILEAMSLGTPVITSDRSSLKEIGGNAALFVNPFSINEIVEAMEKVLIDEIRINLINNGLQRTSNFTWENCASKTLEIYEQVIERKMNL